MDYFRDAQVQFWMLNVLFAWCREHQELSYRQGMHELVAPIVYVVHQGILGTSSSASMTQQLISKICEEAHAIFDTLMTRMKQLYEVSSNTPSTSQNRQSVPTFDAVLFQDQQSNPGFNNPDTELFKRCKTIQDTYLRHVDEDLWKHLYQFQIEPQLYGIRWLKLLYGREVAAFSDLI